MNEVFCTLDLGAVSLRVEELLRLQINDTLYCKEFALPFEGALRVNGSIWAYTTIAFSEERGLSITINKIASTP